MLLNLATALQNDVPDLPKILITSQKPEVARHLRDSLAQGGAAEPARDKPDESRPACDQPDGAELACGQPEIAGANCDKIEVALAPADVPWVLRRFLRRIKPVGLILGENELWPGYLSGMQRCTKSLSVALVSGRFRKAVPGMDFSGLGFATMQTSADQSRFLKFAAGSFRGIISVGGNWKLLPWARQNQPEISGEKSDPSRGELHAKELTSFISLHIEELPFLQQMISSLVARKKSLVIAPRRLEEVPRFMAAFRSRDLPVVQWPATAPGHISLVCTFGKVPEILSRSEAAYVGGSFHKSLGIHDFWEPLQRDVPTFVGPFCRGAESAVQVLIEQGGLVRLQNPNQLVGVPADKACVASALSQEREKILNSYTQLKKFVEELLK